MFSSALPNATKLFPNKRLCVKKLPSPRFKVASYKCLGIRLSFEDPTTLLPGGGGRLRSFEKMPKIVVFSIYILIEQEGVLSQQAAEVKAKEK